MSVFHFLESAEYATAPFSFNEEPISVENVLFTNNMPLVNHIFPKPSKIFHTLVYLTSSSMDAPEQNLLLRKIKMEEIKATETSKTRQMQYSKRISWTE